MTHDYPIATIAADRPADRPARAGGRAWIPFVFALALSLGATGICYAVLGVNLGLFFAGAFIVALLVPPLTLGEETPAGRAAGAAGVLLGVSVVWFYAASNESITAADALACSGVAAGLAVCLAGVSLALRRALRLPSAVAAFLTVLLALAWLTWPVWLSPWIAGREDVVGWLSPAHPLLSINAVLRHLGQWDEQRYAYRMTALVRDVSYAPPAGGTWSTIVHGGFGALLLIAIGAPAAMRKRRGVQRRNEPTLL